MVTESSPRLSSAEDSPVKDEICRTVTAPCAWSMTSHTQSIAARMPWSAAMRSTTLIPEASRCRSNSVWSEVHVVRTLGAVVADAWVDEVVAAVARAFRVFFLCGATSRDLIRSFSGHGSCCGCGLAPPRRRVAWASRRVRGPPGRAGPRRHSASLRSASSAIFSCGMTSTGRGCPEMSSHRSCAYWSCA